MAEPIAFLSYTHFDDQHEQNKIADFCERLSREVRMQSGIEFPIFLDKKAIQWGQRWRERIDGAAFLIAIVTPSYFRSDYCRQEYRRFLEREQQLARRDLILPVYYVDCDEFDDPALRKSHPWASDLFERQYADWRHLRFESAPNVIGRELARLAKQIKPALKTLPAAPKPKAEPVANPAPAEATQSAPKPPADSPTRRNEPPTHIVDAMHRGDFASLQAAIAAAQPGDRLLVRPGLYREGIVINKPLEIIGDGQPDEVILEATGKPVIRFKANMGMVRNLSLRQMGGGKWYGVDIAQGRLVLEDCDITSQSLACVAIHHGADPLVRRNNIHDGKEAGVFVYENGRGTLEDNDIFGNAVAGLEISVGADPQVRNNAIHGGKSFGVLVLENGRGTLEDNDIFGNAKSGIVVGGGGRPTVRRNRINNNNHKGVVVHTQGAGVFEDNELHGNQAGAWLIEDGCEVQRARNQES
jgi:F-box protein 11